MGTPLPPAGTQVVAGSENFYAPPQLPGVITVPPTITTPAFPATTVAVTNTTGVNVMAYITNSSGAITVIKINGVTIGGTPSIPASGFASILIPANQTFTCTYSAGTPAWGWMAV
jgi:hypothetical protein